MTSPQKDALIILPTYNEADAIKIMIPRLLELISSDDIHILVVDDNSPDGTGKIADEYAKQQPANVFVLHRPSKDGLGRAYLNAFEWALENGYKRVVQCDIDGSHSIETLPAMLKLSHAGTNVVIGSRYVKGGAIEGWKKSRWVLSKTANLYAGCILRIPVKDVTAGYRVYDEKSLKMIDRSAIDARGYYFQVAMTIAAWDAGLSIKEVPITFRERVAGYSKMSGNIIVEAMMKVTMTGLKRFFDINTYKRRRKQ